MKILLLDIESAPNVAHCWGLWQQNIGTNQIMASGYILCWAAKWYGEKETMFDSVYQSSEKTMLKRIHKLIDSADAVVHYNGTKFDMPTLNKEFLIHGLTPPAPYKQIDLLRTARSQFRFPSNKLDYICQALGIGEKVRHVGHELWINCMAKRPEAWEQMKKYNIHDVTLLEKVYDRLKPWIRNHPNLGIYNEEFHCPNCGSQSKQRRGYSYSNARAYPRFRCKECGKWYQGSSAVKERTADYRPI